MPIPNNIARITMNYNGRGPSGTRANVVNVGFVPGPGDPPVTDPLWFSTVAEYFGDTFWPAWRQLLSEDTALESVGLANTVASTVIPISGLPGGDRPGALCSPQTATIAQLRSSTPGRRGRGRWFLPDVLEADFGEDGIIVPAQEAELLGALAGVQAACEAPASSNAFGQSTTGVHVVHADGGTPSRVLFIGLNKQQGWIRRRGR